MAARSAELLTETDDDRSPRQQEARQSHTNLTASTVEFTPTPGSEPEFEIIDADENLQPLQQPEQRTQDTEEKPEETEQESREDGDGQSRQWQKRSAKERQDRQRRARDRTHTELNTLRATVADLEQKQLAAEERLAAYEPRFTQIDKGRIEAQVADVDRQIAEQQSRAVDARRRISEAVISQDGDALAAALEVRDQAIIQSQQLAVRKNVLTSGNPLGRENLEAARQTQPERQEPQRQAPRPLTREAVRMANDFAEQHDWVDLRNKLPDGRLRDPDSRLLAMIDGDVMADGYNPADADYWEELTARAKDVLPHRFGGQGQRQPTQPRQTQQPQAAQRMVQPERRGPMTGGASDRGPTRGSTQVYLNADRKMAMIQSGALEQDGRTVADKAKFQRQLKYFNEFDRANGAARQ